MKVGLYVDAYNLYYGARGHCGRSTAGWRWLDIRSMVAPYVGWPNGKIDRVVYCTARVSQAESPSARVDQDVYIRALLEHGSVDVVEEGRYVSWAKAAPLATSAGRSRRPRLYVSNGREALDPALPLKRTQDDDTGNAIILATVRRREEKGSDVNVATHLLRDVFTRTVDAAVVITNDSDLALPLRMAREQVPVGTMNPQTGPWPGRCGAARVTGSVVTGGDSSAPPTSRRISCPIQSGRTESRKTGEPCRLVLSVTAAYVVTIHPLLHVRAGFFFADSVTRVLHPKENNQWRITPAGPKCGPSVSRLLSQRELASRMGTTQSVISRLEEGGGTRNRSDTRVRVAAALGRHLVLSFPEEEPGDMKDSGRSPDPWLNSSRSPTPVTHGSPTTATCATSC